jgi:hypothetical protein
MQPQNTPSKISITKYIDLSKEVVGFLEHKYRLPSVGGITKCHTCVRVAWLFGYQRGGKVWILLPTVDTVSLCFALHFSNYFILK